MKLGFYSHFFTALFLSSLITDSGLCAPLPTLNPLPRKGVLKRPKAVAPTQPWEYRLSISPSLEVISGTEPQSQRGGLKASLHYHYGNWRLYSEGLFEIDGARAAVVRRTQRTALLQELSLEYKFGSFLIRTGRQPVRWSEAWSLPSLDGWTGRRYNRLFFDQLSEQLIHPTGTLFSWNVDKFSAEFFHNVEPAVDILPQPFPESERVWRSEWGVHGKVRVGFGLDAEAVYFNKTDKKLYGTALYFATDHFVPKLEIGQDTEKSSFGIFGLDSFLGKFSLLPRVTVYSTEPVGVPPGSGKVSGNNYNMTVRWDGTSSWLEAQGFRDTIMDANFYSFRYGVRFGKGFEFSCFVQKYEGAPNTLFGLYESMTGRGVVGTKLAVVL